MVAAAEVTTPAATVERIRAYWRGRGWRIFLSNTGRWWATTTRRPIRPQRFPWGNSSFAMWAPDAVDADSYTELVAEIERHVGQRW